MQPASSSITTADLRKPWKTHFCSRKVSTSTFVVSYTHTVTYVTTKMLLLLKEIIREIGLDPAKLANDWDSCERAISTWLTSRHLEGVRLEVYDPMTDGLVTRWDVDVVYDTVATGRFGSTRRRCDTPSPRRASSPPPAGTRSR